MKHSKSIVLQKFKIWAKATHNYYWPMPLVLLMAIGLDFYNITKNGWGNTYYAAAVKSMLQSWHNFFFVSFDPGGFISIDKPPIAFWLQAGSARLFGLHGWSLILPEAIAGVVSVILLYILVRKTAGHTAGWIAALALAIMPANVGVNRNNIVDSILVMTLLLSTLALYKAIATKQLRWLLLCAGILGLAFNEKMLQAYLILPALGLTYLLAANLSWKAKLRNVALALAVLALVSLVWVTAVDATPASKRPYVGSSPTNSEFNLAFGYNGAMRLLGRGQRGSRQPNLAAARNAQRPAANNRAGFGGAGFDAGSPGVFRLINDSLGTETGWLLAMAFITLGLLTWPKKSPRLPVSNDQTGLVLWGVWLLTTAVFFSIAGFIHGYYLATMAPSIAALFGIGSVGLWHAYQTQDWRRWLLPSAILLGSVNEYVILRNFSSYSHWLLPLVGVSALAGIILLAAHIWHQSFSAPLLQWSTVAACVLLLVSPTVWSVYSVAHAGGGDMPRVGPPANNQNRAFASFRAQPAMAASANRMRFGGGFGGESTSPQLVTYLTNHEGKTKYLVATLNANAAAPIILATGKPVMAIGGFMGGDPVLTLRQMQNLVKNNTVRYFLLQGFNGPMNNPSQFMAFRRLPGGFNRGNNRFNVDGMPPRGGGGFGFGGGSANSQITSWVAAHCQTVPTSAWQSQSTNAQNRLGGETLYDCSITH